MELLLLDVVKGGAISQVIDLQNGGAEGSRTPDLLIANETLYQLSYDPNQFTFSGLQGKSLQAHFSLLTFLLTCILITCNSSITS